MSLTSSVSAGLWTVDIDLGPAPSPEDGPPFSANASRDRSLLPYQIVGIVGSYFGSILIIGVLLLTLGKSRRKRSLNLAAEAKGTEMVKPMSRNFEPSPISPVSSRSWYSPRKPRVKKSVTSSIRSGGMSNPASPAGASVLSFDATVVEADKLKRQEEMERLYAAVMAQDDRRLQQKAAQPLPALEIPSGSPPEYSRRKPPRLTTDAPNLRHLQLGNAQYPPSPCSPSTPKSPIRAIYPPDNYVPPMPSGPISPLGAEHSNDIAPYMYRPQQDHLNMDRDRSVSESSHRSSKKFRKTLRNIKISSPMAPTEDNSDGARTPLSPRFYADPGIPPDPPTARTVDTTDSLMYPPTTPGTVNSWRHGDDYPPPSAMSDRIDNIRAPPLANPQRRPHQPLLASPRPHGAASSSSAQAATSPSSINNPLPFRQNPHHAPTAPAKTTLLETRPRNNFLSAVAGTPRTGLATPYSPYMPFTPLTPVTPRLATRAERRQRLREERTLRGALVEEEDAVREEGEIWGSGY